MVKTEVHSALSIFYPILAIFCLGLLIVAGKILFRSSPYQPGKERLVEKLSDQAFRESLLWHTKHSMLSFESVPRATVHLDDLTSPTIHLSLNDLLQHHILIKDSTGRVQFAPEFRSQVSWTSEQSFDFTPVHLEFVQFTKSEHKDDIVSVHFETRIREISPLFRELLQRYPNDQQLRAIYEVWVKRIGEESQQKASFKRGHYGWSLPLSRGPYIDS